MNCAAMQERLSARLSGELQERELAELEFHLVECATCAADAALVERLWHGLGATTEEVPTPRLRARLDALLAAELRKAAPAPLAFVGRSQPNWRSVELRLLPLAAMLLLGLAIGYFIFGRRGDDVADLKREVGDLHEMVALSLLEHGSVSERLQGVSYGRDLSAGGDLNDLNDLNDRNERHEPIIAALFARLLEDPNVNVRLAALEALRPVVARDDRRGDLVAAVALQESPLVALSLIDLLLESGDAAARHDLEQLLANPKLDPAVRGYLRDRLGRSA